MGFEHWWFVAELDSDQYDRILPRFRAAQQQAAMAPSTDDIIDEWRRRPETFAIGPDMTP